VCMCVLSRVN